VCTVRRDVCRKLNNKSVISFTQILFIMPVLKLRIRIVYLSYSSTTVFRFLFYIRLSSFWTRFSVSFRFCCQDTNSASSFIFRTCRKTSGCCFRVMLFGLEFQPSTALLVLCLFLCIFHMAIGTFWFSIQCWNWYSRNKINFSFCGTFL